MRTLFALFASAGLLGCIGGIDSGTGGTDDNPNNPNGTDDPEPEGPGGGGTGPAAIEAKLLFETNVHSVVVAQCGACHGPQSGNIVPFVQPDIQSSYATTVSFTAVMGDFTTSAPILKYGISAPPPHPVIAYNDTAVADITEWLAKEIEARSNQNGEPPPPGEETPAQLTARLVAEWSGCMTLENFRAANMVAWGNVQAGNGGQCKNCHNRGEYGHVADSTAEPAFFPVISSNRYYLAQYFAVDLIEKKVVINNRSFEAVGRGLAPHQQHPSFSPRDNDGYRALVRFYDSTMAAMTAAGGTCGPSKLTN